MRRNIRSKIAACSITILLSIIGLFNFSRLPAALAASKAAHSPAHATISTVDCGNRIDLLELHFYNGSIVCFANAGTITQLYYGVQYITTGNNAGFFETSSGSQWYTAPQMDVNPKNFETSQIWNWFKGTYHIYPFYKGTQFDWPESYGPIAITTIYDQLPTVTLTAGQELIADQYVPSNNGEYMLVMQEDGNLVFYNASNGTPLWASNTAGNPGSYLAVQNDGNSVVYNANGTPLWASNTAGNPGTNLTVQDDGNVVVYNASGTPLWKSTGRPPSAAQSINYNPFAANYSNQCTYYAEERMHEQTGMYMPVYGNAYQWASEASSAGWTVGTTPAVNSVVVFPAGSFGSSVGHVAWVIAVNGNELTVQDYNWNYVGAQVTTHNLPILSGTQFIYSDR